MSLTRIGTPGNGARADTAAAWSRAWSKVGVNTAPSRGSSRSTASIEASTSSVGVTWPARTRSAWAVASSRVSPAPAISGFSFVGFGRARRSEGAAGVGRRGPQVEEGGGGRIGDAGVRAGRDDGALLALDGQQAAPGRSPWQPQQ